MVTYNDVDYFYVYNLQGDVVALIDANGTQVVEYSYDAWGNPISKTGSLAATIGTLNPFRYRGYVYDEETGLYYLRSRVYNPGWKRFVNADRRLGEEGEWILGHDSYTYCFNNPVSLIDPKGEFVLPIVVLPSDITNKAIQTIDDIEFDCGFVIASNVNVGPPDGYYSYKNNRGDLYEIWYDSEGKAKHSRHHSNHGNASKHQKNPHDHDWKDDEKGNRTQSHEALDPDPSYQAPKKKKGTEEESNFSNLGGIASVLLSGMMAFWYYTKNVLPYIMAF